MALLKSKNAPVNEEQLKKDAKKKNQASKSTQSSVPFVACYDNGVIQTKTGCFTKMAKYNDISFTSLSDEQQDNIYDRYNEFLNGLAPNIDCQLVFINHVEDSDILLNDISPVLVGDDIDKYRKAYTESLQLAVGANHANIITDKYILLAIYGADTDKAMKDLEDAYMTVEQNITAIKGLELKNLDLAERLEVYSKLYNGDTPNYYFEHDAEGHTKIDFKKLHKKGLSAKDLIAPDFIKFDWDSFQLNERYGQAMYLNQLPNFLSTNFLKEMCGQPFESVITLYINQIPQVETIKRLHEREMGIENEITDKQEKAENNGHQAYLPHDLIAARDAIAELQDDINNRDQKAFYVALSIAHFNKDKARINEQKKILRACASKYNTDFAVFQWQQERGLNAVLPWGVNEPDDSIILTTEVLGVLMPFDEIRQYEKGGYYYGINKTNKSVIVFNRKGKQNMNALILGSSGSGKSMNAKEEIMQTYFNTKDDIIILDPDREYKEIIEKLHGSIIKIAPGNGLYINPFDLDTDTTYDPESNPVVDKIDYICGLIDTMMGGHGLRSKERSILDKAIRKCYQPYFEILEQRGITFDRDECPTFQTLFTILSESSMPEANEIATVIEPFVSGSFNSFSKRTNVDVDNRLVAIDIFNVGTTMKELALKVCLSFIWNTICDNRKKNKYTWAYIDEFHMLLSSPLASDYVKMIWKRCRKFNGLPCGITQNVEDLLQSPAARAIINNTYYKCIMAQSAMDTSVLQEICNLSDTDIKYVTGVKPGHGLICTEEVHVGFYRNMPKDNPCYDLLNTTMKEKKATSKEDNEDSEKR